MTKSDPASSAQPKARAELPKRFYQEAAARGEGDGWTVVLDGRPVRTPARQALVLPALSVAEAVAAEWNAQDEVVDPASMPLTRLCNSAIDGVAPSMDAVADAVARFAETDLVSYRAESPEGLVVRQNEAWDPLVAWAREELGLDLALAAGIVHVAQPEDTFRKARALVGELDEFTLAALHVMTSLTGSLVIGLSVVRGGLTAEEAWAASLVDEDWQIGQWGEDAEAMRGRRARWRDMEAAAMLAGVTA